MNKDKAGKDEVGEKVGAENRVGKDEEVSWRRMHFLVSKSSSDLATDCVCLVEYPITLLHSEGYEYLGGGVRSSNGGVRGSKKAYGDQRGV